MFLCVVDNGVSFGAAFGSSVIYSPLHPTLYSKTWVYKGIFLLL